MQHHSSSTISVSKYCKKCDRPRPHRVNGNHTVGSCLVCLYQLDPRILSRDELTVMGIGEAQRNMDVWKKERARELSIAEERAVPAQKELFA